MSKLIDAATAAEVISKKYGIPLSELVDVFAEIPDAEADRWISVEDGLPTGYIEGELGTAEPEEYIVQVGNLKVATVAMFDTSTKKFVPSIYSDTMRFYCDVTNWQPLPEPPVGKEK